MTEVKQIHSQLLPFFDSWLVNLPAGKTVSFKPTEFLKQVCDEHDMPAAKKQLYAVFSEIAH